MFCVVFFFFLFRIMFRIIIIIGVRGEQRQNNRERKSDKEKAAAGRAQQTKGGMWAWVFFSLFFAVFLNYIYVALGCSLILIPMHFSESCAMHYERAKTRIWGSLLHASLPMPSAVDISNECGGQARKASSATPVLQQLPAP